MAKSPPCHGADTKTADAEGADAEPQGPEEQEGPPRPRSSMGCDMGSRVAPSSMARNTWVSLFFFPVL